MNTVIYYPHIFPSPDWLKLAAICWNKVYRFVPTNWSYHPVDDPEAVNKLDQELGGILHSLNTPEIAELRDPDFQLKEVNERFLNWVRANQGRLIRETTHQSHNPQQSLLPFYVGKVNPEVYRFLRQQGFRQEGPLLYLPDYIAYYYLSLCASKAAQLYKSDSVTDEQKFTDIIFASSPLVAAVQTAIVQAYLPENLIILEPSRIKDLRSSLSVEKLKFQTEIQSLIDKYGKVSSVGELETVKRDIIEIATKQIEDVKKTFKRSNQMLVLKTFNISLAPPALAASVASLLGLAIIPPLAIAGVISLFAAGAYIDYIGSKEKVSDSPWSYILNVEKMK